MQKYKHLISKVIEHLSKFGYKFYISYYDGIQLTLRFEDKFRNIIKCCFNFLNLKNKLILYNFSIFLD